MTLPDSTIRNAEGSTVEPAERRGAVEAGRRVAELWRRSGEADLPTALAEHPSILNDRSVFFDLAQKEYRRHREVWIDRPAGDYCQRFDGLDAGLLRSLRRLIEVEQCLGDVDFQKLLEPDGAVSWPVAGDHFDGFRIVKELGRGAAGRAYLCCQDVLGGRQVVVKASQAIKVEAAALGRLRHTNVVPVYSGDVDEATGLGWISMPFLGDRTLQDAITDCHSPQGRTQDLLGTRLPTDRPVRSRELHEEAVLRVFGELANGLAYLHQQGLLHGDLKPTNALITDDGTPILIDFNLARSLDADSTMLGGTLPYMAPEQLAALQGDAESCQLNHATDLFAFGVMLHQALVGKVPFEASKKSHSLYQVACSLFDSQTAWRADRSPSLDGIDRGIARLVRQCLAEAPADRPNDFSEVQHALRRLQSPVNQGRRYALHRPRSTAAVVAAGIALIAGAAWMTPQAYYARVLDQAHRLATAEQYKESIDKTRAYLTAYPEDVEATRLLATGLLRSRDYREAAAQYLRAWEKEDDPLDVAMVGYCKNRMGEPKSALAYYGRAIDQGLASCAVKHNIAASRLTVLSRSFDEVVSREVEQLLTSAWHDEPDNESVRLKMLRHYLMVDKLPGNVLPTYPVEIAAFPNEHPSEEFCFKAVSFIAIRSSDPRERLKYGMPCLRRLANLQGAEAALFDLGKELLLAYQPFLDEQSLVIDRQPVPPPPPSYLDPAEF